MPQAKAKTAEQIAAELAQAAAEEAELVKANCRRLQEQWLTEKASMSHWDNVVISKWF